MGIKTTTADNVCRKNCPAARICTSKNHDRTRVMLMSEYISFCTVFRYAGRAERFALQLQRKVPNAKQLKVYCKQAFELSPAGRICFAVPARPKILRELLSLGGVYALGLFTRGGRRFTLILFERLFCGEFRSISRPHRSTAHELRRALGSNFAIIGTPDRELLFADFHFKRSGHI